MNLCEYIRNQMSWSETTFGPGRRTQGLTAHIQKELQEIQAAPLDLEEWIDVIILALEGAWRAGYTPETIVAMLEFKQTKNFQREWPSDQSEDTPIEHVRSSHGQTEPPL